MDRVQDPMLARVTGREVFMGPDDRGHTLARAQAVTSEAASAGTPLEPVVRYRRRTDGGPDHLVVAGAPPAHLERLRACLNLCRPAHAIRKLQGRCQPQGLGR